MADPPYSNDLARNVSYPSYAKHTEFSSAMSMAFLPSLSFASGSAPAARKCLTRAGLNHEDIDLWEINEAFASVPLRYMRELGIDHEMTNVNGGAIAMGHPLGATGGCLVSTVLDELERRGLHRAMISLCVGGGMGISTIIERC
jgi:acetyl-CoA C-acetyltransferase